MTTKSIGINRLVKRQTKESKFSYFDGQDSELIDLVMQNLPLKKNGQWEGSYVVPIANITRNQPPSSDRGKFFSCVTGAKKQFVFRSVFISCDREDPLRLSHNAYAKKPLGQYAEVVIYSRELLSQLGKQSEKVYDYEIVSIHVSPDSVPSPPHPYALLRKYRNNSLEISVNEIMESIDYWSKYVYIKDISKLSLIDNVSEEVLCLLLSGKTTEATGIYENERSLPHQIAAEQIIQIEEELLQRGYFDLDNPT